jgi:hypothetical protein
VVLLHLSLLFLVMDRLLNDLFLFFPVFSYRLTLLLVHIFNVVLYLGMLLNGALLLMLDLWFRFEVINMA